MTADRDATAGPGADDGAGGVTAGDLDLGGVDEAQERRAEGGDPVAGDAVSRVAEEPPQAIDPDVARNSSEPIRVADRGPGGGTPPGTPPPV